MTLHIYGCKTCGTVASTPARGRYLCNLCHCVMRPLYSMPVETDEHRRLFARGLVYNPGREVPEAGARDVQG